MLAEIDAEPPAARPARNTEVVGGARRAVGLG